MQYKPKGDPDHLKVSSYSEHTRNHSTSSSECSCDSDARDAESEASTRRVATPSKGGADRRRVAIMQITSSPQQPSALRSRRGHRSDLTGLALVAPPDAAARIYTHLSPPLSAPLTTPDLDDNISATGDTNKNQNSSRIRGSPRPRSQSPPDHNRGLLTTPRTTLPSHSPMFSPVTPEIGQSKDIHIPVAGPVIVNLGSHSTQTPSSRTNTPDTLATPVSPTTSSYLHYQPGVHSIAGPLPPPPRANFNIDIHNPPPPRPPRLQSPPPTRTKRDLDAVKQALQLPPSVTAILSSNLTTPKSNKYSDLTDVGSKSETTPSSELSSVHRREGAFSAEPASDSTTPLNDSNMENKGTVLDTVLDTADIPPVTTTKPLNDSNMETTAEALDTADVPSVTVIEPPPRSNTLPADIDHHKFSEWLKSNPALLKPLENERKGGLADETCHKQKLSESPERCMSPESGHGTEAPSPPPKSFRNSLTTNIKRLSLSRTASLSSKSGRRWSGGTHYSSRTPSPSLHRVSPTPRFKKIRSTNPAALFCHEVNSQRTTSERCLIYATKINELYAYDCGLSEWVVNMKSRGPNTQHQRSSSAQPFAPQPRHTSRSSIISEATFPRRPDASTATDLSQGTYEDITPTAVSLTLPYPSLAMNPPRTNPSRSNSSVGTPPSSIRSLAPSTSISKTSGFFASLGRKASLSKKDRPNNILISSSSPSLSSAPGSGRLPPASSKHTAALQSMNMNISRPINVSSPPSVPGGPRAHPHRAKRSQTYTPSFPPTSVSDREGRRPSMFDLPSDTVIDIHADPEFYEQVDKLVSLLPHANRDVLAGYLRHTGQDMLAIGQYLEDEKNGTIWLYD
ncbi:hypothetical protein BYT27DRAFT_7144427 [Phlegmacium glaucopus]|nr:hypothetical protein BYT27DRAFT_7144427 [Phlegmacium glaucopus]